MAFGFNPFTGNFDLTGGGDAAPFAGQVDAYADLPLDSAAALNSRWLVKNNSGTWPFSNYKQAGIYIRVSTAGASRDTDYQFVGTLPSVMNDSEFLVYDDTDATKNLKFQLSGITTGTTRTLTAPNASGRIQVEGQAIGDTTPAAGTFTTLTANNGTLTASAPVLDLAQTWDNAAVTFTGLNLALTNTASASASSYFNINLDGVEAFSICRGTSNVSATLIRCGGSGLRSTARTRTGGGVGLNFENTLGIGSSLEFLATASGTTQGDVALVRDGVGVLGQRRGANAQTFNIYNTFTDATNHERLRLAWASNVAIIGTEKGSGGGTARDLVFQTDGTTRFTIAAAGAIDCASGFTVSSASGLTLSAASAALSLPRNCNISSPNTGILQFRSTSGTNAEWRVNGGLFSSGGANAEYGFLSFQTAANIFQIGTAQAGTGVARAMEFVTNATARIRIGTAGEIGFFGATAAAQPAAVADATDAASTQARLNDLLARLRTLGLIAT